MKKIRRTALWLLLGLAVLVLVGVIVVRLWFNAYLNSTDFRKKIADATARALKADGDFMPLHFSGTTVYSDGFEAHGSDAAFFSQLRADQLRADFNWHGMLHHRWQIDEFNIQRLDVTLAEHRENAVSSSEKNVASEMHDESPLALKSAWQLDLRKAVIRETNWRWNGGGITGATLTLTPDSAAWLIDAQGGKLAQSGWPELRIESARLRYQAPSLFISDSSLRNGDGTLSATGEINFERAADLQAQLASLDVTPILPKDWRAKLHGKLSGDVKVRAPLHSTKFSETTNATPDDGLVVEGSVRLIEGQLEALPILNQIATFTRTQRFRQIALSKASCDFRRDDAQISARNIVIESEGLMRVEGQCTVIGGNIDGAFQVGVTPASLQWLPGSQSRVFTVARGGYLWTPVHLSGPADHPSEDLTPRLVAAAGSELIEGATKGAKDIDGTLRETTKSVLDLLLH